MSVCICVQAPFGVVSHPRCPLHGDEVVPVPLISDAKHICVQSPEEAAQWERRRDTGAAERRKYALLNVAALLTVHATNSKGYTVEEAVDDAELLLAEIERRQK